MERAAAPVREPLWFEKFLYAGLANAAAGFTTNPMDVLKVRMQMQRGGAGPPLSMLALGRRVVATEGASALMRGWQASVMREMSYSAIRMGLYDAVKDQLAGGSGAAASDRFSFPLWKKILAGGVSGCIGAAIANPTDLLKVRAQAPPGADGRLLFSYPNPWTALGHIYRHEGGWPGLYRGVVPTTQRAAILTAAQLSTYDEVKYLLLGSGLMGEGLGLHFISSCLAGLAVATTTNPIDLVKSRFMNQPLGADGRGLLYSGVADCLRKTVAAEGLRALYKGWLANWLRIGPHTVVTFICFERLRGLAGIGAV